MTFPIKARLLRVLQKFIIIECGFCSSKAMTVPGISGCVERLSLPLLVLHPSQSTITIGLDFILGGAKKWVWQFKNSEVLM